MEEHEATARIHQRLFLPVLLGSYYGGSGDEPSGGAGGRAAKCGSHNREARRATEVVDEIV